MKKIIAYIFTISTVVSVYATAYNVKVETYVGGRIEDKFEFVIKENEVQCKGYDGKYQAKRFLAKGYEHMGISSINKEADSEVAQEKKTTETEALEDKVSKKLFELRNKVVSSEKVIENANMSIQTLREQIEILEGVEKLLKTSPSSASVKYEQYANKYEASDVDPVEAKKLARLKRIKYRDYEEYDVGSYCRMKIVKVINPHTIRFSISYAYSRLLSMAYHDGKNTDNAITKYPIFEIFERLNAKAKITLGKPYCIQFTRPKSSEEAKTIQDAIAQTRLFSGADVSNLSTQTEDESEKEIEKPKGEFDTKGSYEKIKEKYKAQTSQTVRAVFTVTALKQ